MSVKVGHILSGHIVCDQSLTVLAYKTLFWILAMMKDPLEGYILMMAVLFPHTVLPRSWYALSPCFQHTPFKSDCLI